MKKNLDRNRSGEYVCSRTRRFLMSTKQKLGFISVVLASAVSVATLVTFCFPVPYRAGSLTQEVSGLSDSVAEIKEDLDKQGHDIGNLKENVSYIRGLLEAKKEEVK
jgi:hypothetical protein